MSTVGDAPLNLTKPSTGDLVNLGVLNSNYDAINSYASTANGRLNVLESADTALDTRLDAIEANGWVTNARLASGAVAAGNLASSLDLTTKSVLVTTATVGTATTAAASTAFATNSITSNNTSKNLPTRMASGVLNLIGLDGSGAYTLTLTGFSAAPVVVGSLVAVSGTSSAALVLTVASVTSTSVIFRIYDSLGAVAGNETVTINWIAIL
jgi:hypothetical protein